MIQISREFRREVYGRIIEITDNYDLTFTVDFYMIN